MNIDRNIHIGLFIGGGSSTKGIESFIANLSLIKNIEITKLTPENIITEHVYI